MAVHDTIGDFLTLIRNASRAQKAQCTCQFSKMRVGISEILRDEGYIEGFAETKDANGNRALTISLKYVDGVPALSGIERVSKPGCREYCGYQEIPRVLGGLGIAILTTSRGVMRARDARREKIGGELVCNVW
jgi:small subunit ribosomal protein S8